MQRGGNLWFSPLPRCKALLAPGFSVRKTHLAIRSRDHPMNLDARRNNAVAIGATKLGISEVRLAEKQTGLHCWRGLEAGQ